MAAGKLKSWFQPKTDSKTRESPNDFMLAFLRWKSNNPERNLTPKAFAIIRSQQDPKKNTEQR